MGGTLVVVIFGETLIKRPYGIKFVRKSKTEEKKLKCTVSLGEKKAKRMCKE
jgi:hypothetical protein